LRGGGERVGEENLWLWGKKKNPSYPKRETRRVVVLCHHPLSLLSSVLSVEEDERRKKVSWKEKSSIAESAPTRRKYHIATTRPFFLSFFPPEAKH
jgi:hypothetical protein